MSATKHPNIRRWKIARIKPYESNPRKITTEAIQAVAESIKAFGWTQPIVVDGDGVILAGHVRLLAAQELKQTTVPVLVRDDLTEDQARAYRLADNRVAEFSGWDVEKLNAELGELNSDELRIAWTAEEIEMLGLTDISPGEIGGTDAGADEDSGSEINAVRDDIMGGMVELRILVPRDHAKAIRKEVDAMVKKWTEPAPA